MPHVMVKLWPSPAILRGTNSRVGRIRPEKSPLESGCRSDCCMSVGNSPSIQLEFAGDLAGHRPQLATLTFNCFTRIAAPQSDRGVTPSWRATCRRTIPR